jgi:hypothetical protein
MASAVVLFPKLGFHSAEMKGLAMLS